MVTCPTILVVLVPLLAVGVYYSALTVTIEYEFKTPVRAALTKTFNHLADPENLRNLIPNIVEVKILEHKINILDEEDGIFKDVYIVSVIQDLPYKSGFTFNFTRKVSASTNSINTQGDMMGFITYQIIHSLQEVRSGQVEMTEHCTIHLPRALSWLISGDVKRNHQQLNNKIKEELEKGEKVAEGTQTNN